MTRKDIAVTRESNGAWVLSAMYKGYRVQRMYFFTSRGEAIAQFITDVTMN
jgi:hypothetical protein